MSTPRQRMARPALRTSLTPSTRIECSGAHPARRVRCKRARHHRPRVGACRARTSKGLGFLVAYPARTARANGSKCWNWFRTDDQARGRGEPAMIAGIVGEVAADYRVDPQRVFVAGLSAGAAMAVILGETYPDVFAAVGAHSGLPFGAAHDMGSAFTAMSTGAQRNAANSSGRGDTPAVSTIVFHGDADHTVAPGNGQAIVRDATAGTTQSSTHAGVAPGGRAYKQEVFVGTAGQPRVEYWTVHGAGHAWSGGSKRGTYTDPSGPDASAEMVRFFLQADQERL
ncbi:extracellular catalytic domain type 1 short-chain-length polyhydroxyalkanoate depolymerase [Lysobacter sp. F6437]|uniref:extracellular catalytic domain type 1 short-chain-length polyhydroxyalkanoate depolymerase n=1 Tax=Lysobacter sp. F6437 TaxID=3459296 RepID=UPI00403DB029